MAKILKMQKTTTFQSIQSQNGFSKKLFKVSLKRTTLIETICFLFVLLFVYAAVSKLIDYQKFRVQLGQSPLLSHYVNLVAWTIPGIEILISIMLITTRWRLLGLYGCFFFMVMFSEYIIAITKFSNYVPCSCGGILQKMNWNEHLIFNLFFIFLGLTGILLHHKKTKINTSQI